MTRALILTALCTLFCSTADADPEKVYSQVRIFPDSWQTIRTLPNYGIFLEHFSGNVNSGIELVVDNLELSSLQASGIRYEVITQDMEAEYRLRPAPSEADLLDSGRILRRDDTEGFELGSMGGFYTFNEVVEELDSMRLAHPNLITAKSSIGTSHEGRDIWMVKISDNADVNESATEAVIYYDALHHAREPAAMMSTVYYMYWLLENYGTDPAATYLVDHREMFFVPVVNPDGYVYNEQTNPNGGGMWRKNRRDSPGSCWGVDLNRNYSFGYGYNNGSSSDPCSDTYRGPNAFSEPETESIEDLLAAINPVIGFSVHTYGEKFLNPFGYIEEAPEYEVYSEFSSDFVAESNYLYGITAEMLGYFSSGTTRDYLQSEGTYGWTPELGDGGFWPAQSQIIPIASENRPRFAYIAWVGGAFADFRNVRFPAPGHAQAGDTLLIEVGIKNRGLTMTAEAVNVSLSTTYPNAIPVVSTVPYGEIQARATAHNTLSPFRFALTQDAAFLDEIPFIVSVTQEGVETSRDTILFTVGDQTVMFSDDAEGGTSNWSAAGAGQAWDTTFVDSYDGTHSFADSRYGNSENSTNSFFTLNQTIDLSGLTHPRLSFSAKWSIETGFDFARVQISSDGGSIWTSLPGRYTTTVQGQPSYTGSRHWKQEDIDLSAWAGHEVLIRFHYDTDGGVPGDGFYFDNLAVTEFFESTGGSPIPCEDIVQLLSKCRVGVGLRALVRLANENHDGRTIEVTIDGTDVYSGAVTGARAVVSAPGIYGAGDHTVELTDPSGCLDPSAVTCAGSPEITTNQFLDDDWWPGVLNVGESLPISTRLLANYPNPFNPTTDIIYTVSPGQHLAIAVFDLLGRRIATLVDGWHEPGEYAVTWDGRNDHGSTVAGGVYVYRMTAEDVVLTRSMLLLK